MIDPVQPVKPVGAVGAKKIKGLPQPRLATPRPKLLTTKGQTPVNPFGANKMTIKAASLSEFRHHQVMRKMAAYDPMAMALLALRDEQEKAAGLNLLDDAVNIGRVVAKGTKGADKVVRAATRPKTVNLAARGPAPVAANVPTPRRVQPVPKAPTPAAANVPTRRAAPPAAAPAPPPKLEMPKQPTVVRDAERAHNSLTPEQKIRMMSETSTEAAKARAAREAAAGGAAGAGTVGEAAGMGWRAKAGIGASLLGAGAIGGGMATGGVMAGQQQNQMAMLQRYNQGVR